MVSENFVIAYWPMCGLDNVFIQGCSVYQGVCNGTVGGRQSGLPVCRLMLRCPLA